MINISSILSFLRRFLGKLPGRLYWQILYVVNQKFLIGVAGVIFNEQGQVLLFKHTYRAPGYAWGLPTGWLKGRESPEEGLKREIYEESHLHAAIGAPLIVHCARGVPRLDLFYRGTIIGGCFEPSGEVSEARFFDLDDLPTMLHDQRQAILTACERALE